jgi:hypothetical protein
MTNELATIPNNDGATLLAIIQQAATQPDFDVAKMQQLMELKREWDKDRAAEAYAAAISEFQRKCPQIHKGRKPVSGPSYTYASYDDVMVVVSPILAECGIAVTFSTDCADKAIKTTCRLRVGTHYEDHVFTIPVPEMRVNETQKYGSALTYAKRYALQSALNIVVTDEDTDAGNLTANTITDEQAIQLEEWIESTGADRVKFLAFLKVEKLADLPASKFANAMEAIQKKAKR